MRKMNELNKKIDVAHERYPFCIVWTPIPLITWLLPFVGHMGICNSEGIIHDFAGPYYIGQDCMAFGDPVKYWDISHLLGPKKDTPAQYMVTPQRTMEVYDEAIASTTGYFRQTQMYNFFCNNCHSFVASCLEAGHVGNRSWNMVKLAFYLFFCGKYISFGRFMKAHLPFLLIVIFITVVSILTKPPK